MARHIFRLTHYKNIPTLLNDGEMRAINYLEQSCFRTSYPEIVNRRADKQFITTPCGSVVNDFVPFYFSPLTAMAYTIYKENIKLRDCNDIEQGITKYTDIVFLVSHTNHFLNTNHTLYFSNVSCNTKANIPKFESDLSKISGHINWGLFDEQPITATIKEIGYNGVCKYFLDRDDGLHANRSSQRMAEFLVKDYFPLDFVDCIITQNDRIKEILDTSISQSHWDINVFCKPNCYFSL